MSSENTLPRPPETTAPTDQPDPRPRVDLPPSVEVASLLLLSTSAVVGAQLTGPTTAAGNTIAVLGLIAALGLVLLFRYLRRDPWSSLGLARPDSWLRTVLLAFAATPIMMAAAWFVMQVLTPMLGGEAPDVSRFDALKGNLPMLLGTLASVWITAAFIEEVVFRGFLMGRLARIFGGSPGAWIAALFTSSIVFGLLHIYQGLSGVVVTGFVGFLLGGLYLLVKRNLWVGILTHGLIDTVSLVAVYFGFEA